MDVTQIYIFSPATSGIHYLRKANTFLQEIRRVDGAFVVERIDIVPAGKDAQVAIIARVRWGMAEEVWKKYLEVRAKD